MNERKLLFNRILACCVTDELINQTFPIRPFIVNPMRNPARCANRLNDLNFRAL